MLAMDGVAGVTLMEIRLGALTVTVELPVTCSKAAEMTVVPGLMPDARPAALTPASVGAEEVQFTEGLMFWVVPSLNEPVAVNCRNNPTTRVGFAGVTVMETTVALVTVRAAEARMVPEAAVITVFPGATPEAMPEATLATEGVDEVQVTADVTS